jgi:methylated-DNA-[protein]-cysteine S-methyltransferase
MEIYTAYLNTAVGPLAISGTREGITAVQFVPQAGTASADIPPCIKDCTQQLTEYFAGHRGDFSLLLAPQGTPFQRQVWDKLCQIPFGQTISYRQLAEAMGNPRAVRAVGRANATNKLNIIVPCHRVIGSDGSLTGYGGGVQRKEWLISHERQVAGGC